MSHCFDGCTSLNQEFDFSKVITAGNSAFTYCWNGCINQNKKIDFSNLKTIGSYCFDRAFFNQKTNRTFDFKNLETAGEYAFRYAFAISTYDSNYRVTITNFENLTSVGRYCFQSTFHYTNPNPIQFLALESITTQQAFDSAWDSDVTARNLIWHPFPKLKTINSTSCFSSAFRYSRAKAIIFDSLETVGATGNNYATFSRALEYALLKGAGFVFPALQTVGSTSANNYSHFSTFAQDSNNSVILQCPELTTINSYSSTANRGQFASCGAIKIYMPKLTAMNGYPQYVFNGSTTIQELHLGIENQTTIQSLNGYNSKFGASNATIYFDLVNHITVDETVYDRYGNGCDYDNEYFAWKNNDTIIYTKEQWTPAVGDVTYTKSEDSYVSTIQTITEVA